MVKNLLANAGDARYTASIPGSGRSPGVGNDYPLQYPGLENPMGRGAWQAIVHGAEKSSTCLSTPTSTHPFLNPVFLKIFANDVYFFPKHLFTFKVLLEIVN